MLTAYYAEHLRLKELAHDKESDEEKMVKYMEMGNQKKEFCYSELYYI